MANADDIQDDNVEDQDDDLDLDLDDDDDDDSGDQGKDKGDKKDDDKKSETPEAKSARLARMQDRHDKKHGLGKYANKGAKKDEPSPKDDKKSGEDLDYGQKAFLASSELKIQGKKELALVKEYAATGKSLDDILENRHFQNDLKDLREAKAADDALPKGTKRAAGSTKDSVEYYLKNGGLPPADQTELRRKVVDARSKASKGGDKFSPNPVVK